MRTVLIIGAGYSVSAVFQSLISDNWSIVATTRDMAKAVNIAALGGEPLIWDAKEKFPDKPLKKADTIIVSVAPNRMGIGTGCPVMESLPEDVDLSGKQIIYLSSTGVYGNYDGAYINEDAVCKPETLRGKARLAAEAVWREGVPQRGYTLNILRLSGIYGPGRNAVESLAGVNRGINLGLKQRIIKPGQVFNRIHRDDIARVLMKAVGNIETPSVLNIADDLPAPPQDVISYAAELLGTLPPPEVSFVDAEMSPMVRSFYADNKRLENFKLKEFLIEPLTYPTYRVGLAAIMNEMRSSING